MDRNQYFSFDFQNPYLPAGSLGINFPFDGLGINFPFDGLGINFPFEFPGQKFAVENWGIIFPFCG